VEWASNILLDGGPVASTQTPDTDEPAQSEQDNEDLQQVIDQLTEQTLLKHPPGSNESSLSLEKLARTEIDILSAENEEKLKVVNLNLMAEGSGHSSKPDSLVMMCHKRLTKQGVLTPEDDVLEQVTEGNTDRLRSIDEYQHQHFQAPNIPSTILDDKSYDYLPIDSYQHCANPSKPMNAASGAMALDEFHLPPPVSRRLAEIKPMKPSPTHTLTPISSPATMPGIDTAILKLTPQLAQQLIQMFGPVEAPFIPG
jgi:hypothetical protein